MKTTLLKSLILLCLCFGVGVILFQLGSQGGMGAHPLSLPKSNAGDQEPEPIQASVLPTPAGPIDSLKGVARMPSNLPEATEASALEKLCREQWAIVEAMTEQNLLHQLHSSFLWFDEKCRRAEQKELGSKVKAAYGDCERAHAQPENEELVQSCFESFGVYRAVIFAQQMGKVEDFRRYDDSALLNALVGHFVVGKDFGVLRGISLELLERHPNSAIAIKSAIVSEVLGGSKDSHSLRHFDQLIERAEDIGLKDELIAEAISFKQRLAGERLEFEQYPPAKRKQFKIPINEILN